MPRIKSAKKAMRQSRRHAVVNRAQRSALRTALKRVRGATTKDEATQAYRGGGAVARSGGAEGVDSQEQRGAK